MARNMNMDLIYRFFDAVNMHRWNDHLRPIDLTEVDKQSHKAAIAWILGKYEEENGTEVDWQRIIEHTMFSFLKRTVLTDLKPQLLHRMEDEKFDEVNDFVISEVRKEIPDLEPSFMERFEHYLREPQDTIEDEIVSAAHYMATNWEFNIIYDMNKRSIGIEQTKTSLAMELSNYSGLQGVKRVIDSQSMTFVDLIGQLRFQQRWTRIPRMPQTTVLGHSLIVANMMYLHDLDEGVSGRQIYNDYYTALFHDLPEVLTKDVITPVKVNVHGLVEILDEYEHELVNSKIMPLIPEAWRDEFRFLTFDPFADKDDAIFGKVDGKCIKLCDVMGAYLEANVSRRIGIHSSKLRQGEESLRERLIRDGGPINASDLIERFEKMEI